LPDREAAEQQQEEDRLGAGAADREELEGVLVDGVEQVGRGVAIEGKAEVSGTPHTASPMLVHTCYGTRTAALLCLDALSADEQGKASTTPSGDRGSVTGTA
jgi:hypothetical protein